MDAGELKARAEKWIRIWDFCNREGNCNSCELGKEMPGVIRCQSHLLEQAEEIIRNAAQSEEEAACKEPG